VATLSALCHGDFPPATSRSAPSPMYIFPVMAGPAEGRVPATHVFRPTERNTWMAGTSPVMMKRKKRAQTGGTYAIA
jgi:hypothetical protein